MPTNGMGLSLGLPTAALVQVLEAAGVVEPKALAVVYTARGRAVSAVAALRAHWPRAPILARALDQLHAAELRSAGADTVVTATAEAGLELGYALLAGLGAEERRVRLYTPETLTQDNVEAWLSLLPQRAARCCATPCWPACAQ